jgi:hypothetical protein
MNTNPRQHPPVTFWMTGWIPFALLTRDTEFRDLEEYLKTVQEFVRDEGNRFTKEVEERARKQNLAGEDADHFFEAHEQEFERWHSSFPNTVLSTVLIAACSRFESGLTELCKDLEKERAIATPNTWESFKKQRIQGITRAAYFLNENFGIDPQVDSRWQHIAAFFKIRDAFVHADGNVSYMGTDNQGKVRTAIQHLKATGLREAEYGKIELTPDFFDELFRSMIGFWIELRKACRDNAIIGPVYWR